MHQFSSESKAILSYYERTDYVRNALQLDLFPRDYQPALVSMYVNGGSIAFLIIEDSKVVFHDTSEDCLFNKRRCPDLFVICFDGEPAYIQAREEVIVNRIKHVEFIIKGFQTAGVR